LRLFDGQIGSSNSFDAAKPPTVSRATRKMRK
jgi:hypothetical protein